TVHHVQVDPVRTRVNGPGDLIANARKVRRQKGRGDHPVTKCSWNNDGRELPPPGTAKCQCHENGVQEETPCERSAEMTGGTTNPYEAPSTADTLRTAWGLGGTPVKSPLMLGCLAV